jgi:hypothetical protein
MARRTRQNWDSETERSARNLDSLAEYEEFCHTVLPQLRRMVLENWPPEKIRKTFGSLMQAQVITKALQGNLRAIQDTLDRLEGKSTKRQEVTHPYAKMSKAELAALAYQKLLDAGIIPI